MTKVENGNTVSVHYTGTLNDGSEFDSSYSRGEPIAFQVGSGQMIAGFDSAVVGMSVGDEKSVSLTAAEAYGPRNDDAVQAFPRTAFAADMDLAVGSMIQGQQAGRSFMAQIVESDTHTVTLDLNHPMAGKDLNFKIELVDIS